MQVINPTCVYDDNPRPNSDASRPEAETPRTINQRTLGDRIGGFFNCWFTNYLCYQMTLQGTDPRTFGIKVFPTFDECVEEERQIRVTRELEEKLYKEIRRTSPTEDPDW